MIQQLRVNCAWPRPNANLIEAFLVDCDEDNFLGCLAWSVLKPQCCQQIVDTAHWLRSRKRQRDNHECQNEEQPNALRRYISPGRRLHLVYLPSWQFKDEERTQLSLELPLPLPRLPVLPPPLPFPTP